MSPTDPLIERLDLGFVGAALLETALTHRSYVHERWAVDLQSNERLEFLGDSVLNFLTAQFLYHRYPAQGEGELTALRAALVRTSTLARWAREIELGRYLRLGKGEEQSGGRDREPLLADAFEALVAAVFLAGGAAGAETMLLRFLEPEALRITEQGLVQDDKSRLQERVQGERNKTPRYRTTSVAGPEHDRRFTVEVWAGTERLGVGVGSSKQSAAQTAAREALRYLDMPPPTVSPELSP